MSGNKKINIIVFYEKNCGGETVATDNILRELSNDDCLHVPALSLHPLVDTEIVKYFYWILKSIVQSLLFIVNSKDIHWVYTTTYTAELAAVLLKPLAHYHICFHYHGNRIPPREADTQEIHRYTQLIKHDVTYWLHSIVFRSIDMLIVPSLISKTNLIHSFPMLSKKEIVVIPNGVDTLIFKPLSIGNRTKLRQQHHITQSQKVLSVIGRLNEKKNIHLMIKAFPELKKSFPAAILFIVYPKIRTVEEHEYYGQLRSLVNKSKLSKHIVFIESPRKIEQIYGISDMVVSLSTEENFPLVMLEAFASGVIFTAYKHPAVRETLIKADDRLIINTPEPSKIAHTLLTILRLPNRDKETIIREERSFAKELTWRSTANQIKNILFAYPPRETPMIAGNTLTPGKI
jgi:glycosyltransferase involved in cell wall biosynthesis